MSMTHTHRTMSTNQVQWTQPSYADLVEGLHKIVVATSSSNDEKIMKYQPNEVALKITEHSLSVLSKIKILPQRVTLCTLDGGFAMIYMKNRSYAEMHMLNSGEVRCTMIRSYGIHGETMESQTGNSKNVNFQVISPSDDGNTIPDSYDNMLIETARRINEFLHEDDGQQNQNGETNLSCKG